MKEKKYNIFIIFLFIIALIFFILSRLAKIISIEYILIIIFLLSILILNIIYALYCQIISNKKIENISHEQNKRLLENIIQISNSVLTLEDPKEIFDLILSKAVKSISGAKMGSLLILNEDNQLEYKSTIGYDFEKFRNLVLNIEDCFLYEQTKTNLNKACIIRDIQRHNKSTLDQTTYNRLKKAGGFIAKTTISAPIKLDNKFYGIINVDSDRYNCFTNIDLAFMEYFAIQVSTAIKNHKTLKQILYMARHDNLTGLHNRHYFEELLPNLSQRAIRYNESFTIAVFDLDNLKMINDTFGHQVGDQLIQEFAIHLKACGRTTDIIARYGGDEFVAVYLYTDLKKADKIINKLNNTLNKNPISVKKQQICIKFSYGAAHFPSDNTDIDLLFKIADDRMYAQKYSKDYKKSN